MGNRIAASHKAETATCICWPHDCLTGCFLLCHGDRQRLWLGHSPALVSTGCFGGSLTMRTAAMNPPSRCADAGKAVRTGHSRAAVSGHKLPFLPRRAESTANRRIANGEGGSEAQRFRIPDLKSPEQTRSPNICSAHPHYRAAVWRVAEKLHRINEGWEMGVDSDRPKPRSGAGA